MTTAQETLIDWAELKDIELVVLKRMQQYAVGAHPSVFHGAGFDFVGLRDWQPGDRPAAIDWAQSTLTNFSPMVTREFEQESTASIMIVADTSMSTRCGVGGTSIAKVIARAVATLSLAGAFFQDQVGLVTLDGPRRHMAVRPRVGKNHAIHCVEAYQTAVLTDQDTSPGESSDTLAEMLRKRSLVPVVSDFLLADVTNLVEELAQLSAVHDVFLVVVDSAFAFELPAISAGWLETYDVETAETRLLSRAELRDLVGEIRDWQTATEREAQRKGLEVVRVGVGNEHTALSNFLRQRRLLRR